MFREFKAFSLLEIMMALVVVSIMLAVMAPVLIVKDDKTKVPEIQVVDSTPVGVIVAWYGSNYPDGWLPMNGQPIEEPRYEALRQALNGVTALPDLNNGTDPSTSTTWIIKAEKK